MRPVRKILFGDKYQANTILYHCNTQLNFSLNSNKTLEFLSIINKGNIIIICIGNNGDYKKNRNHGYFHITLKLLPIFQNVIFISSLVIQFLDLIGFIGLPRWH